MTEAALLAAIKSLAVTAENPKVARVTLSRMTQDRTEPIRSFAARLRGQAEVCRFIKKCPKCDCVTNQGEERVADQLCIGLADAEIQEDLLKNPNQDLTVEETIKFIEVCAAGKRSALTMSTPMTSSAILEDEDSSAVTSSYRKQRNSQPLRGTPTRRHPTQPQRSPLLTPGPRNSHPRDAGPQKRSQPNRGPCAYCGQRGHRERVRTVVRRTNCPAFGTTCSSCGRQHHYPHLC